MDKKDPRNSGSPSGGSLGFDPRTIAHAYDRASCQYDHWKWQEFWRRNEQPLVGELLGREGTVDITLDIGMGTGAYVELLYSYSRDVVGIDVSMGMLNVSQPNHPTAVHVCASAFELPFREESFQRVLAARMLSHYECIDGFFAQASRVISAGGSLIVTDVDPTHNYQVINLPGRAEDGIPVRLEPRNHSVAQLSEIASRNGLYLNWHERISFADLRWKPEPRQLPSLDRSGHRRVFYVVQFRKQIDSR